MPGQRQGDSLRDSGGIRQLFRKSVNSPGKKQNYGTPLPGPEAEPLTPTTSEGENPA